MNDTGSKNVNPENELKKLLNAHMLVLKDKLGRSPTTEEIAEALKNSEDEQPITEQAEETNTAEAEPKVLKLKVYYGQTAKKTDKGEAKSPDPRNILFYENHEGKCFDCKKQEWLGERPHVLDHIPSRPLLFDEKNADIVDAILNGILDDEDMNELEKSGALKPHSKKIYDLQKKASAITQELEKSTPIEVEQEDEAVGDDDQADSVDSESPMSVPMEKVKTGTDVVKSFMDTTGVQHGLDIVREEYGEKGADLFSQILQAALADVDEKTRMLVREEVDACMAPVLDAIEALASHIGVNLDVAEPQTPEMSVENEGDDFSFEDDEENSENELTEDDEDDTMTDESESYP